MADEYSKRFGLRSTRSSAKPSCYGDVDTYDSADEDCQECPVRPACKIVVDRKIERELREDRLERRNTRTMSGRHRSRERDRTTPNRERVNPGEKDSFFVALFYNGFLSASSAVLQEARHGVESIPMMKYPDPFERFRSRD